LKKLLIISAVTIFLAGCVETSSESPSETPAETSGDYSELSTAESSVSPEDVPAPDAPDTSDAPKKYSRLLEYCYEGHPQAEYHKSREPYEKSWQYSREENPQDVYSAEEWMAKGYLDFPFDPFDLTIDPFPSSAKYYIPEEALKQADTADLLRIMLYTPYSVYIFNEPSHYLPSMQYNYNVTEELLNREDFAEVLLEVYENYEFMPWHKVENGSQSHYDIKMSAHNTAVGSMEAMLGYNITFEDMSDEMRQRTVEAVAEKAEITQDCRSGCTDDQPYIDGEILYSYQPPFNDTPFFARIKELQKSDVGSRWHEYLNGDVN
jgi:hypothetical protein